jgi:hypothetical protein
LADSLSFSACTDSKSDMHLHSISQCNKRAAVESRRWRVGGAQRVQPAFSISSGLPGG